MFKKSSNKPKLVKPCFPYPGGKTRFLKTILPLIPDHRVYVEPFAGGLAVLLAKPPSAVEIINDIDHGVANFYRYVRFHFDALISELTGHLNSRENFKLFLENPGFTDLQKAANWYLLRLMSYGGMSSNYGRCRDRFKGFDPERDVELIKAVSVRLSRVQVENQDWEKVVEFYDSHETFHFFDPPYVEVSKTAYRAFEEFEMQRVRNRLDQLKGNWLLTCDDSPACRSIFAGLPIKEIKIRYSLSNTASTAGGSKTRKESGELIVIDPRIAQKNLKVA